MNETMYSRGGKTNDFGKSTEDLKTHVPELIKAQFLTLATEQKVPASEKLRDVITDYLHGSISKDLQEIIWEHAKREIKTPFLLGIIKTAVFGHLHAASIPTDEQD